MQFRVCLLDQRNPSITGCSRSCKVKSLSALPGGFIVDLLVEMVKLLFRGFQFLPLRDASVKHANRLYQPQDFEADGRDILIDDDRNPGIVFEENKAVYSDLFIAL